MAIAVVVGAVAAFWIQLHGYHRLGASTGISSIVPRVFGAYPYTRLEGWLKGTTPRDMNSFYAVCVGFAFALALNWARMTITGFPLNPVGYAIAGSFSVNLIWFSLLIAWIVKLLALRYGGLRLYRQMLPFFFGLVIGESLMWAVWSLVGIGFGIHTYSFWP